MTPPKTKKQKQKQKKTLRFTILSPLCIAFLLGIFVVNLLLFLGVTESKCPLVNFLFVGKLTRKEQTLEFRTFSCVPTVKLSI